MSYASASDLCTIDAINKQFQGLTTDSWETITNERYGMKNGKEGWIMGTSLLRKPVYIHINRAPDSDDDMYYAGSPQVTAHNSLIIVNTDDTGSSGAPEGTGIYNARDLSYIGPQEGGGGWRSILAGPDGSETYVINMAHNLIFRRGSISQGQRYPNNRNSDGIPVIACKSHVIAVIGNTLNVYRVEKGNKLVELCHSELLGRECRNNAEYFKNDIQWGVNESEFVVYHSLDDYGTPGMFEISVRQFDADGDSVSKTHTIEAGINLTDVAMSEDFIVGASKDKKIRVWDRHTMEKKPFALCDVKEEDELDQEDIVWPLRISLHGHILVSTSHIGCALCVWNIKKGRLLKRYNDADEDRRVDMLPDGCDVTSMAYLKHLNGYICATGFLDIWAFPTNQSQKDMSVSIRKREQDLREAIFFPTTLC